MSENTTNQEAETRKRDALESLIRAGVKCAEFYGHSYYILRNPNPVPTDTAGFVSFERFVLAHQPSMNWLYPGFQKLWEIRSSKEVAPDHCEGV